LIEILNNSSIDYDFLKLNQVYLANISRKFLIGRCTYKIKNNKIYSPQLSETYDIFHCTHLSPLTVNKLPQVTTVHDIIPLIRPELVSNQSLLAFANLLKVNIKNSVKIIAVSQATKDDLVKYCQVPPEKVVVVYEAAREEFKPVDIEIAKPILKKLSLTSLEIDTPYFMFIGNIEPKKNIRRLLLAFKQFSMRDKRGCKLVIVGNKAWGFDDVKDLIKELINDGIVINTGYLQTNQIPSLLSHAQALIFPSLIEGFGLPVLEAMACGCPVITSDIPCIREITGDAALRVNPLSIDEIYQAIKSIAEDRSLRNRLHHAGLLQSQLFSWQRCAKETIAVYHEAIYEFYKYKQ
jgi:glycosyltransferase involved in cell wall biosynthesis